MSEPVTGVTLSDMLEFTADNLQAIVAGMEITPILLPSMLKDIVKSLVLAQHFIRYVATKLKEEGK